MWLSTGKSKFPAIASGEKSLPKGRVKTLFSTSKFLSDRVMEAGKYELHKILDSQRNKKGKWKFLCE